MQKIYPHGRRQWRGEERRETLRVRGELSTATTTAVFYGSVRSMTPVPSVPTKSHRLHPQPGAAPPRCCSRLPLRPVRPDRSPPCTDSRASMPPAPVLIQQDRRRHPTLAPDVFGCFDPQRYDLRCRSPRSRASTCTLKTQIDLKDYKLARSVLEIEFVLSLTAIKGLMRKLEDTFFSLRAARVKSADVLLAKAMVNSPLRF